MAGHYDAERVAAVGGTHRPHRLGIADGLGYLEVADGLTVGNVAQGAPYRLLKRGAPGGERQIEAAQATGEVGSELLDERGERQVVPLPLVGRGHRLLASHELHVTQPVPIDGDEQGAMGAVAKTVLHVVILGCRA